MRQPGERIETLGLTTQRFRQHLARQVRVGDAMAAAALRVVDVVADTAHLRQARKRQQEVAYPGEIDLHVL